MPEQPAGPAPHAGRNLRVAIATGLGLAAMIFGTLLTSRAAWFLVVFVCVLLAQWEFYGAMDRRGLHPATILGCSAGAVLLIGAYAGGIEALSFGLSMTVIAALLWFLAEHDRSGVADRIALTFIGVAYVPMFGAHVVLMRDEPGGIELTIAFFVVVVFHDIGAYAAGSLFGRHKIAPSVSPGKTWEGLFGGTVLSFFVALLVGPLLGPLDTGSAALLALAASVLAPLGDLFESMLKRDLGVKDMGSLLPGHGGMLDRIDALLVTVPAAYWIMRWVL